MDNPETQPPQPEEIKFAKVDINFLNRIIDYLKTCPYEEVEPFMDVFRGIKTVESVKENK